MSRHCETLSDQDLVGAGGGGVESATRNMLNCGVHISARNSGADESWQGQEVSRLICIQNMLLIEVLKLRWALDTGNQNARPTLDQLDRYSRDAYSNCACVFQSGIHAIISPLHTQRGLYDPRRNRNSRPTDD